MFTFEFVHLQYVYILQCISPKLFLRLLMYFIIGMLFIFYPSITPAVNSHLFNRPTCRSLPWPLWSLIQQVIISNTVIFFHNSCCPTSHELWVREYHRCVCACYRLNDEINEDFHFIPLSCPPPSLEQDKVMEWMSGFISLVHQERLK